MIECECGNSSLWVIKKRSGISGGDQEEIMWNFNGFLHLAVKIPMVITQFCGISRGEASFCLEFPWVK